MTDWLSLKRCWDRIYKAKLNILPKMNSELPYRLLFLLIMLTITCVPLYAELKSANFTKREIFKWFFPCFLLKYGIIIGIPISIIRNQSQSNNTNGVISLFIIFSPIIIILIVKYIFTRFIKVKNLYFFIYDLPTNLLITSFLYFLSTVRW